MIDETRTPHSGALPNYQQALIPLRKLRGYLLNPSHLEGKHKARVFNSALGFKQSDSTELAEAIRAELPYYPATTKEAGVWGQKYEVALPIIGKNDRVVDVMTVWIVREGTLYPRLVTAFVIKRRGE
jgi:hypothetical protein